jgi:hypothetical protein
LTVQQKVASALEARTAIGLIEAAIGNFQRLDGANDEVHLPLQLLAQGFERLLKLTLAFVTYEQTGSLPTAAELKTHDLEKLLEALMAKAATDHAYASRPAVKDDLAFLAKDPLFLLCLNIVASFAKRDRYHDLTVLLSGSAPSSSPAHTWSEVENALLDRHPEWRARLADASFDGWWEVMGTEVTALIERFTRALARMWTFGPAQRLGKPLTAEVYDFVTLPDSELGKSRAP